MKVWQIQHWSQKKLFQAKNGVENVSQRFVLFAETQSAILPFLCSCRRFVLLKDIFFVPPQLDIGTEVAN